MEILAKDTIITPSDSIAVPTETVSQQQVNTDVITRNSNGVQ